MPSNASPKIVIIAQTPEQRTAAEHLAEQLQLPYLKNASPKVHSWALIQQAERLALQFPGARKPFSVDFLQGPVAQRLSRATWKEPLARAVGLKKGVCLKIIDGTAGWGSDAMLLAKLGAEVTAVERSPIVAALLQDGIRRAQQSSDFSSLAIQVVVDETREYLQSLQEPPEVIYLDPMFPESPNSALVKKPLQVLQLLLCPMQDADELAAIALTKFQQRLVIKRPSWAAPLIKSTDFSIPAGIVRFDIYLERR